LRFFGFGPSIIKRIKTFYCKIESCILNNGWSSNFFQPQRGVRQGFPLSPYLFILAAEMLAKTIRSNRRIKGFHVNKNEGKISQYADDTTLILDGSRESLVAALQIVARSLSSGSMIVKRKLFGSALRLGKKKSIYLERT